MTQNHEVYNIVPLAQPIAGMASGVFSYHLEEWRSSGVSLKIIRANVRSIDDSYRLKILLNHKPKDKWKHPDYLLPGWGVSGVDPTTGDTWDDGFQFKPDTPPVDDKGRPRKYIGATDTPTTPLFLDTGDHKFWPGVLNTPTTPILITEGAKKAGAALTAGFACISIPGVSTGQKRERLKPELEGFACLGRNVYLAFDRDIVEKPAVAKALETLGRLLSAKGCVVHLLEWGNETKGLDDWLVTQDDPTAAIQAAIDKARTLREWQESTEDTPPEDCGLRKLFTKVSGLLANQIRWNELLHILELNNQPLEQEMLRLHLALAFNLDVNRRDAEMICLHLAKRNSFHPIRDYLSEAHQQHGGEFDLNTVAPICLGSDDPIHIAYIRKFLISCVARVMRPGCKVDSVLILQGGQGVGKSSFFRLLCPDPQWFDDSFGAQSDKDERLKLHESWICEWGELESVFRRKDLSALKSFITCQTDKIRPPYAHKAESFHRPSVLVGSTNQLEFLADSTGNRRFHVLPVPREVDLEWLVTWRDRIWASAYDAFLSGEKWELPQEMREGSASQAEEFEFSDSWDTAIAAWMHRQAIDGMPVEGQLLTVGEILEKAIGLPPDRQTRPDQMRVADSLKRLGFERSAPKTRPDGVRSRFWFLPEKKVSNHVDQVDQVDQYTPKPLPSQGFTADQPPDRPSSPTDQPPEVDQQAKTGKTEVDHLPNPAPANVTAFADQPDRPDQPVPQLISRTRFPGSFTIGDECRYIGPKEMPESIREGFKVTAVTAAGLEVIAPGMMRPVYFPNSLEFELR